MKKKILVYPIFLQLWQSYPSNTGSGAEELLIKINRNFYKQENYYTDIIMCELNFISKIDHCKDQINGKI